MKFDKNRIYTAVNADEVKVGSKGAFAYNMKGLREKFAEGELDTLIAVNDESDDNRFVSKTSYAYSFFYLVEEPEEKHYRPYKDTDEMIEDFKKRYNSYGGWSGKDNPMYNPLIWVKHKETQGIQMITGFSKIKNSVTFNGFEHFHSLGILLEQFTYLDGTPCGKLEE